MCRLERGAEGSGGRPGRSGSSRPRTSGAASRSRSAATRSRSTSVITNPAADPHDYEPTPADARAMAGADLVIVNGVGYDPWATTLLAASPGPLVINVGDLVGAKDGDNPHLWYNPAYVRTFISALTRDLQTLDPAGGFAHGAQLYETAGLKRYDDLIAAIRHRYAGTAVGASESIFAMLAPALGLRLVTPPSFLRAISEGSDVSAADKRTIDRQIASRAIAIYVYNRQNATPDVQAQLAACRAHGIPIAAHHRDDGAGRGDVPAVAGRPARRNRAGAGEGGKTDDRASRPPDTAVSFHDAAVTVGGRAVWSDVNLRVAQGEFVAILGPNGAGKSTLIKAALGADPAVRRDRAHSRTAAGRGQPRDRLPPPAPQLRRQPAHARGRHRAARDSTARAGVSRCCSDAARIARPPHGYANSSTSSAPGPTLSAPSASCPEASSSGCSSPRRWPTIPRCCCSTSRSTAWICLPKPRSPRCSVTSASTSASP